MKLTDTAPMPTQIYPARILTRFFGPSGRWGYRGNPAIIIRAILLLSILLIFPISAPDGASAQRPNDAIDRIQIGPYDITVVGGPSQLSLGIALYSVTLLSAEDGQPVSDAQVRLLTRHEVAGVEGWAAALNGPATPALYKAQLQLDRPGRWAMSVEVTGPLGRVEAELTPMVIPQTPGYGSGSLAFVGVTVVLLLGVTYLVWTSRRIQKRRAANAE